jgi:hypothetical protein
VSGNWKVLRQRIKEVCWLGGSRRWGKIRYDQKGAISYPLVKILPYSLQLAYPQEARKLFTDSTWSVECL